MASYDQPYCIATQNLALVRGLVYSRLGMSKGSEERSILDILYKCRPCPIPRQIPCRPFLGKVHRPCPGTEFADF